MPTASEMIVQTLEEAGVEYVFGIPGGGTGQIFQLLYGREDRIKTILVRHEQVAAIMADAYGRATGKPAVVMGQGLFIGSNASFGIMEAMLSSSPMLVLTDTSDGGSAQRPANQSGTGEYGSIDLPNIFKSMSKYTALAASPKEAVLATQVAIKHAISGRPGPASVVMRSAAISGEVDLEAPPFIHNAAGFLNTAKPESSPSDVLRVIEILSQSRRPVLVAGNGVHVAGAHAQLQELAELWGMPVATSYKGKSAIAETHPLSVGMVGTYGQAVANRVVGEADTVIVVGALLRSQETVRERPDIFDPRRQRVVQIDIDERNAGWSFPVELGLVGDAGSILNQLVAASKEEAEASAAQRGEWTASMSTRKTAMSFYGRPGNAPRQFSGHPAKAGVVAQREFRPVHRIRAGRGQQPHLDGPPVPSPRGSHLLLSGGTAGMGWALPAAVGLKLVYPDRPVTAVTGDGGFMMTVNSLSTAMQYDLPITCVVFNDTALEWCWTTSREARRLHQSSTRRTTPPLPAASGHSASTSRTPGICPTPCVRRRNRDCRRWWT